MIPERVEEQLFRWAERAADDPVLRARVRAFTVRAVRVAIEAKRLGIGAPFQELKRLAIRWANWRAPRLRDALGVDVNDMGDLGRIQDWEDALLGVDGTWSERSRTHATKLETACPYADLAKRDPSFCTEIVHALEEETFRALNPRYRLVPLDSLLSKGHAHCAFRHELRPETTTAPPSGERSAASKATDVDQK